MTLDDAIDELYGADLADFVSERTRLAKELRAQDQREDAEQVAKLRKPTAAAWAVNQLPRRHRREVDLLLDAGHRLRQAQAGVLRGEERAEFDRARATERDAVQRLTQEADRLLGGTSATVLKQIADTLRAAAVSEEGREQLVRGRFVTPLESEGFGVLSGLAPTTPPSTKRPTKGDQNPTQRGARRAAQEALREARGRLRDLDRLARAAEATAGAIEREWTEAKEKAVAARAEADAAAQAVEDAERVFRESG